MKPVSASRFRALFDAEAPFVWRVLRHLGVPASELPDVAQEVFVVLFRRFDDFDPQRSRRRTWVYGVVRNVARNHGRLARHRREQLTDDPPERSAEGASPERALEQKRARQRLAEALDQLTAEQREVFVLHELEGLTVREIAEAANIPVATGHSRLRLARGKVEASMRRALTGEAP